jgi:hypothetical protein
MSSDPPQTTDQAPSSPPDSAVAAPAEQALQHAFKALLEPLARLAVGNGVSYAAVEELLKLSFVQAAAMAHPGGLPHRKVSRISTTTGINRREVTRLMRSAQGGTSGHQPSLASEVFAHWRTKAAYRSPDGQPLVLRRQGPAPSFESLAQTVTRDVHPRSLLDELCRLGQAHWDPQTDEVRLLREVYVPEGDQVRLVGLLGHNVGDHLRAAVDNVLRDDGLHFEQAVFADGLTAASIASVRPAVRAQWSELLGVLVPALEAAVQADASADPPAQGRLRVGLYSYHEVLPPSAAPEGPGEAPAEAAKPRRSRRKT